MINRGIKKSILAAAAAASALAITHTLPASAATASADIQHRVKDVQEGNCNFVGKDWVEAARPSSPGVECWAWKGAGAVEFDQTGITHFQAGSQRGRVQVNGKFIQFEPGQQFDWIQHPVHIVGMYIQ